MIPFWHSSFYVSIKIEDTQSFAVFDTSVLWQRAFKNAITKNGKYRSLLILSRFLCEMTNFVYWKYKIKKIMHLAVYI